MAPWPSASTRMGQTIWVTWPWIITCSRPPHNHGPVCPGLTGHAHRGLSLQPCAGYKVGSAPKNGSAHMDHNGHVSKNFAGRTVC
jgi:hypothetical protein